MCDIYSTRRALMLGLWFSFWAIRIVQTDPVRQFRILPKVEKDEQINEEGSTLTLTCMDKDMPFHIERFYPDVDGMKWQPPLSQWEDGWKGGDRLNITTFRNKTYRIATMTLINLKPEDTGYYTCKGPTSLDVTRFVYVSSAERLILMTKGNYYANYWSNTNINNGNTRTMSFTTTHPNVSISLFKDGMEGWDTYLEVWNSSSKNSRWSFDPRKGLTLKNPTVSDSGIYCIVGRLPFVNGKPVNITFIDYISRRERTIRERITKIIRKVFPLDRIDTIEWIEFPLIIPGIEAERVGAPDDPVVGSNVTLICTYYKFFSNHSSRVFTRWFYYSNWDATWYMFLQEFLKEPNAVIQNVLEKTKDGFYQIKLHLINVTLNTPYTKFKCVYGDDNTIVKEISFTVKEIDDDPVSNLINLEKGVGKNLICNRWSQDVAIHWLKDGMAHSDLIYENETASVVQLQGKEKEKGTYECRWKNSKGKPRHRNFTVGIISYEKDEKDANTIIISASFIGLLAVAVAIGIKVYLDKRNVEKQLENRLNGDPSRIDPLSKKRCVEKGKHDHALKIF